MGDQRQGGIAWTDETWNPVRGCSRVSEGCRNCYAERVAARFCKPGQPYHGLAKITAPRDLLDRVGGRRNGWTGEVRIVPEHLGDPLKWRRPRRVFVNSMSDLFHEKLTNEEIAAVFGVMAAAPRHTFQVLTKRADRMRDWFEWVEGHFQHAIDVCLSCADDLVGDAVWKKMLQAPVGQGWPLRQVWLGVSVEDQRRADERIPLLLETPAAVRFVSAEPLLGPVDLGLSSAACTCCPRWPSRWVRLKRMVTADMPELVPERRGMVALAGVYRASSNQHGALSVPTSGGPLGIKPDEFTALPRLDWVIVGAESGRGARQMDIEWARALRDQCSAAGVPFFLKQFAERGRKISTPELDGRRWVELPEAA